MDEVSFELAPAGGNYDEELSQIKITVNGTDFPELVRQAELPSAGLRITILEELLTRVRSRR